MSAPAPDILVLCGSPHEGGASEKAAGAFAAALGERGADTTLWRLSEHPVAACRNCGGCAAGGECVIADAWHVLSRHMDACDALLLVSPVYFAGPPAHLKAALDRCQSYWMRKYRLHVPPPSARPARLVVLGEGGDPFGTAPLEAVCTSALNCANLRIDGRVECFVGRGAAPGSSELAAIADALLADAARTRAPSEGASPEEASLEGALPAASIREGAGQAQPAHGGAVAGGGTSVRGNAPAGDGALADSPDNAASAAPLSDGMGAA